MISSCDSLVFSGYQFDMFPQGYWTLWSDLIIGRIHERVLRHVKELAEADG